MICDICGEEVEARGFSRHYQSKRCYRLQAKKEKKRIKKQKQGYTGFKIVESGVYRSQIQSMPHDTSADADWLYKKDDLVDAMTVCLDLSEYGLTKVEKMAETENYLSGYRENDGETVYYKKTDDKKGSMRRYSFRQRVNSSLSKKLEKTLYNREGQLVAKEVEQYSIPADEYSQLSKNTATKKLYRDANK